jgi:hypothetical protein
MAAMPARSSGSVIPAWFIASISACLLSAMSPSLENMDRLTPCPAIRKTAG